MRRKEEGRMRMICVLLSVIASGFSGAFTLFLTAVVTMILFGGVTTLTMSIVRIVVNFGVAGLAAAVVYSETHRYLGAKLVPHVQ